MARITQRVRLTDLLRDQFEDIKDLSFLTDSEVRRIADITRGRIISRTKGGIGADDQGRQVRYLGYRPSTKKIKRKDGQQISPVNLTDTDVMLKSIHTRKVFKNRNFTLALPESERGKSAGAHDGVRSKQGLIKRPFLNLTRKDRTEIVEMSSDILDRAFERGERERLRKIKQ